MNYLPRSLHRVINWKVYILYAESPQTYHHVNESGEAPESIYFVLHDDKYWCQKITHALNVPCSNQTTWWSPHCAVIPDDDETESPVSHRRTQWSQTTSLTLLPYHITLCCDHRRRWDRESSVTQKNTLVSDYQSHIVTIPHHTVLWSPTTMRQRVQCHTEEHRGLRLPVSHCYHTASHCAVITDDDETESPVSHRRTQWSQTTSLTLLPYHITLR